MSLVQNLFSQGTIERLGWMLVHFLWQATAVAVLLAVVLRLLRRADANLRYVVACLALGLIVVLPVITIQLVEVAQPVTALPPTMPASGFMPSTPAIVEIVDEIPAFDGVLPVTAGTTAPMPWQERLVARVEPALPYVVLGWLAGVFGLSAWHLGGWAQLQRLKRRMVCEVETSLRQRLANLSERLGVRRAVRLLESAVVEVPTVVGWLRPVILLPASALTGLSTAQLKAILAHELAHIRRCDYLMNVLQTIVEILGFYHPAVWWVSHRIRIERENCCDDLAVRICGSSLQYARALTSMEEIRHRRTDLALAAAGGSLMSRIARLLGRPASDDRRFTWLPGLLALLVIIGLVIPAALALGVPSLDQPDSTVAEALSEDTIVPSDGAQDQIDPNEPPHVQVAMDAKTAPSESPEANLLLNFTLVKAKTEKWLDRETVLQIENILGESIRLTDEDAGARQEPGITLGEVLRKYIVGKPLPPETVQALNDLLPSKGHVELLASPQMQAPDGQEARLRIGTTEYIPTTRSGDDSSGPPQLEKVECGTTMAVTARLRDRNTTTLELAVELTDLVRGPNDTDLPLVRTTAIESTMTVPNDCYFSLLAEPATDQTTKTQETESILVMVKPSVIPRRPVVKSASDESPKTRPVTVTFTDTNLIAALTVLAEQSGTKIGVDPRIGPVRVPSGLTFTNAPITKALEVLLRGTEYWFQAVGENTYLVFKTITRTFRGEDLRQVLLDVLMVRMEAGDLAKLGIEWGRPTLRAGTSGSTDNTGKPLSGVQIGYAADQAATDSFLAAVTLLQEQGRAKIVANPQLVAQDGRESGLRSMMEKWLSLRPATNTGVSDAQAELHKVDYGTALSVTPYIGDSNEITLTMAVELSESLPRGQDLPVVTRRVARNSVTIRDGGTVAVAGLTQNYAGQNGTSTEETVIFVTAHVVSTSSQAELPAAPEADLQPSAPHEEAVGVSRATAQQARAGTGQTNIRPRLVLLNARIVAIRRSDLLNLGITWASPTFLSGDSSDPTSGNAGDDINDITARIQIGSTPDRAGTDALVTALNELCADHRAETISTLQALTQDRREGRYMAVEEEWFWMQVSKSMIICGAELSKLEHGPIVSIVPHVGREGDIMLETAIDVNGSMRQSGLYDILSVLSTASATVAIQDGGMLVWAGLPQKVPSRETAIFVTVRLMREAS